eukprot:Hpha_TRINITY_DN16385_c3_g4::TRINITY_DN16385_c3_g4_i1::g.58232::m.58232
MAEGSGQNEDQVPSEPVDDGRTLALTPEQLKSLMSPGANSSPGESPQASPNSKSGRGRARGAAFRYTSIEQYEEGGYLTKPIRTKVTEMKEATGGVKIGMTAMQGWRKTMEDAHCITTEGKAMFVGVFDGHCGEQAAKMVAEVLPKQVRKHLVESIQLGLRGVLKESFKDTDDQVFAALDAVPSGAGCTAVAVLTTGGPRIGVAWAGDARVVLCRGGAAVPLSNDHKPQGAREQQRITEAGGTVGQGRVSVPGAQGRLAVARAFGDAPFKKVEGKPLSDQPITALADITIAELVDNDEFIVLACDGIWDKMTDQQVVNFVRKRLEESNDLTGIAGEVCDNCLASVAPGLGCDNMTICIITFGPFVPRSRAAILETTSHDLNDQWAALHSKGDIPEANYKLVDLDASCSFLPDEVLSEQLARTPLQILADEDNDANPQATVKPMFVDKPITSFPASPKVPHLSSLPRASGALEHRPERHSAKRRMGGVVCACAALLAAGVLIVDAVREASVGAGVAAGGCVLCGSLAVGLMTHKLPHSSVDWVLLIVALWALAADAADGLIFEAWVIAAAVAGGTLANGDTPVPGTIGLVVTEIWLLLRTIEEVEAYGLRDGLPDSSLRKVRFNKDNTWEWGVGVLIWRHGVMILFTSLGFASRMTVKSATRQSRHALRFCEDMMLVVSTLDTDTARELLSDKKFRDIPRSLQRACTEAIDSLRLFRAYVPDSVLDSAAMEGSPRARGAQTGRSRGTSGSGDSRTHEVAWGSSSGSSKSDMGDRRRSTPRGDNTPRSPQSGDTRRRRSLHPAAADREFSDRLRTKNGSLLVAELDLERIDSSELSNAVRHFCANVVECAKLADATVLTIAGANVICTWNTHKPATSHQSQACQCGTSIESYMNGLNDSDSTRPWWSIALAAGQLNVGVTGGVDQRSPIVVGHPVATAMHMGVLARTYLGSYVVANDKIHEIVRSHTYARPVDVVRVPHSHWRTHKDTEAGFGTDVVYELLATRDRPYAGNSTYIEAFCALQTLNYQEAEEKFLEFLAVNPKDRQAQRLLRITVWLSDGIDGGRGKYSRELVGWEDLEANSAGAKMHDKVAAAVASLSSTLAPQSESCTVMSTDWSEMGPRRKKESVQHDKVLRRQIREAEALHNADQLVAWGIMTEKPEGSDEAQKGVPVKFTDHRERIWVRAQRCLGKGAFGEVFLGMGSEGGLVAIKTMRLPMPRMETTTAVAAKGGGGGEAAMSAAARRRLARKRGAPPGGGGDEKKKGADVKEHLSQIEDLLREVGLMHKLKHENIVQYLTSAVVNGYIMIVMEFLSGGSLSDVLSQFGSADQASGLPVSSIRRYTRDIVAGLAFLHSNDIIHRDMKPHNVLLLVEGQCKLADFGASAQLNQLAQSNQGVIGTPLYMAPEAARGAACKASDVWGLGCIFCQLFSGQIPYTFSDDDPFNPHTFLFKLAQVENFFPTVPALLPPDGRTFVGHCLRKDPEERCTAEQLKTEPFLVS